MIRSLSVSISSTVVKHIRMFSKFSYEDAVARLNNLQSNKATIEQIRRDIRLGQKCTNIEDMQQYLLRTGISLSKLDTLSVIHVAGTKGKGSTCAMCESILHHHGYKTGFYSSPHLVEVRERIRLNGQIISKEKFSEHFRTVFEMLESSKAYGGDMPKYFAFLTVLAFNIFLKEKVDVAIIEVGIGGTVDYTNVLRKVSVVGITPLGLDHTSILGNTIEEISQAKAGIMKPYCEAYTIQQTPEAMSELQRVAKDRKCKLHVVPDYKLYSLPKDMCLHLPVEPYFTNASLAIQLSHAWMNKQNIKFKHNDHDITGKLLRRKGFTEIGRPILNNGGKNGLSVLDLIYDVPIETIMGLKNFQWPGRYQIIQSEFATFYLDGAHTKESMEICVSWFMQHSRLSQNILIFSATGDRDIEMLLKPLKTINFKAIYFVIPTAYKRLNEKNDNYYAVEQTELVGKCERFAVIWQKLHCNGTSVNNISIMECVADALISMKQTFDTNTSVLITGSLHLVGAALSIIDKSLSKD